MLNAARSVAIVAWIDPMTVAGVRLRDQVCSVPSSAWSRQPVEIQTDN